MYRHQNHHHQGSLPKPASQAKMDGNVGRVRRNPINLTDFEAGCSLSYLSSPVRRRPGPNDNQEQALSVSKDDGNWQQQQQPYGWSHQNSEAFDDWHRQHSFEDRKHQQRSSFEDQKQQQQYQQFSGTSRWDVKDNGKVLDEKPHQVPRSRSPITQILRDRPGDPLSSPQLPYRYIPTRDGGGHSSSSSHNKGNHGKKVNRVDKSRHKGKKCNKKREGKKGLKNMMPIYRTRRNTRNLKVSVPPPKEYCETQHLDNKKKELFRKNWYAEYHNFGYSSYYLEHHSRQTGASDLMQQNQTYSSPSSTVKAEKSISELSNLK